MKTIAIILFIIGCLTAQNISSFYVTLAYMAQHQIGHDEAYKCAPDVLLAYLQQSFKVNDTTHEQALQDAGNVKPLATHLEVEILEAKNLVGKNPNGKSDSYCVTFIESSETQCHNTAVQNNTLAPVWNERVYLTAVDAENDALLFDVWHVMHAETVLEKMRKVGDVHGMKGFYKLGKQVAFTCTAGNTDDKLIGSVKIRLKDIPLTGKTEWYRLEKPGRSNDRGFLRLGLAFTAENNTQIAIREHRRLLRTFLSHELVTAKTDNYRWQGNWSPAARTLLNQHRARNGLFPRNVALSEWVEYSVIHEEHPLHFSVFDELWNELLQPMKDELFSSDDVTLFWEAARKIFYSCFDRIKTIESLPNYTGTLMEELTHILRIVSSIASLDVPENFDLFPNEMYSWLPEQRDTEIDPLQVLEYTVREKGAMWFSNRLQNNILKNATAQEVIEDRLKIVQLAMVELQRASNVYDKTFIDIVKFPYTRPLYTVYQKRISDLCEKPVRNVCLQLTMFDVDNNFKTMLVSTGDMLSEALFKLYEVLQKFVGHGRTLGIDNFGDMKIHNYYKWFKGVVLHWLNRWTYEKAMETANSLKKDNLDTAFDPSGLCQLTSAHSVRSIHDHMTTFWTRLAWPYIKESLIYLRIIMERVCEYAIAHADAILAKVKVVTSVSAGENATSVRTDAFYVLRVSCFAINNIDHVKKDIRSWALHLQSLADAEFNNATQRSVKHFREAAKVLAKSTGDILEDKIVKLLENIVKDMGPVMRGYLMKAADELFDTATGKSSMHGLNRYLIDNMEILDLNLPPYNFQRIRDAIWETFLKRLFHLVHSNLDKARPRLFYSNLREGLPTLLDIFANSRVHDTAENINMFEKIQKILQLYGMRTTKLICQYYKARVQEQKDLGEPTDQVLTVGAQFANNRLIVRILHAKNLRPMRSDGKTNPFVKVRFLPKDNFHGVEKRKTRAHLDTLHPLFDKTFNISLTTEQRNLEGAILVFEIMTTTFILKAPVKTTFMAEAFLPFREIPVAARTRESKLLKWIHLNLSRPGNESSRIANILKSRPFDDEAKQFIAKLKKKDQQ